MYYCILRVNPLNHKFASGPKLLSRPILHKLAGTWGEKKKRSRGLERVACVVYARGVSNVIASRLRANRVDEFVKRSLCSTTACARG